MQTVKHALRPHSQGQALKKELRKNAGLYLLALIPFVYLSLFKSKNVRKKTSIGFHIEQNMMNVQFFLAFL